MNLEMIAVRTGLPLRTLRYAADRALMPGVERKRRGHRVTRNFSPLESFGLAVAAAMVSAGVRATAVREMMGRAIEGSEDTLLFNAAFGRIEVLVAGQGQGWVQGGATAAAGGTPRAGGAAAAPPYAEVHIDARRLFDALFTTTPPS